MSKIGQLGNRHVHRIAQGVLRNRLVDPVLFTRPTFVLVGAPSGYGKSVLAAQLATHAAFTRAIWIDCGGSSGSAREALVALADALHVSEDTLSTFAEPELAQVCATGMSAIPEDTPVCVVLDDVGWSLGEPEISLLLDTVSEAPLGSLLVVTTREEARMCHESSSCWRIGSQDLLLSDDELSALWELAGAPLSDSCVRRLHECSGRHAALASILVRKHVLSGVRTDSRIDGQTLTGAIRELATQLPEGQRTLLDVAALMSTGSLSSLERCLGVGSVLDSLMEVSEVLPLVAVNDPGNKATFSVHSSVCEALSSVELVASADQHLLESVVAELASCGQQIRAIEIARSAGSARGLADALESLSDPTIIAAHQATLRDAMTYLEPAEFAKRPALILLNAQLLWQEFEASEAIRLARMALHLAEHADDATLRARSLALGLRMRSAAGDLDGTVAEVRGVLDAGLDCFDAEQRALVAFSGIMSCGLLGDRAGLAECSALERTLRGSRSIGPVTAFRLATARGVVAALLDGDWTESIAALQRAARGPVPLQGAVAVANQNLSTALLEAGYVQAAEAAVASAKDDFRDDEQAGVCALAQAIEAAILVSAGRDADLRLAVEHALDEASSKGDWLSATSTLDFAARVALLAADLALARSLAEQAVQAALRTGSPVLLWLAELTRAQVALVFGDLATARDTSERILRHAERVGAHGHVVRARLILAAVDWRSGEVAAAVQSMSSVAEQIIAGSPVLTVASFLGPMPDLLGPLALAIEVGRIPTRLFEFIRGPRAELALESASSVLSPDEVQQLRARMHLDTEVSSVQVAEPEPAVICRVRLFGGLEVVTPKGKVGDRDWTKRKARLLFAMLVARFGTDVPRGEIVEYLWPEMDEERSLNNFYVVWSAMKRALTPGSVRDTPSPFVEHTHGVCRVLRDHVISDLDEFRELLADARKAREIGDADKEVAALRAAEALYRGDVLPGDVYDDWFASVRDRYRHDFEDAMLRLAQLYLDRDEPHDGLAVLRKVTSPEMWREDLFQALLRLQIAAGQRSAAIETYMLCRARLTEDLGIDPSRETTALYEQILGMEEGVGRTADGYGTADDGTLVRKW